MEMWLNNRCSIWGEMRPLRTRRCARASGPGNARPCSLESWWR
jgi:hypothetical protein